MAAASINNFIFLKFPKHREEIDPYLKCTLCSWEKGQTICEVILEC